MLFASIFLSFDLRETLPLGLYHKSASTNTSKPLRSQIYIIISQIRKLELQRFKRWGWGHSPAVAGFR